MKNVGRRISSLGIAAALVATGVPYGNLTAQAADEQVQQQFYVSPSGSDKNNGKSSDKPFQTFEKARQAVDKVNDDMKGDIVVNFAPGDYYMEETVNFTTEDSGTNGHQVIYRASGAPGSARIIGGEKVTGEWKLADESDQSVDLSADMIGKVYKIELGEETPDFNTLYVNEQRATMARTLNREDSTRFPAAKDTYMYATGGGEYSISYPTDKLPQAHADAIQAAIERGEEGCQVYGWDWNYRNWFTSTIPVTGISGNTLKFSPDPNNRPANRPKYTFESGARFFLQGNLAFLDTPGEYHYNKRTNVLYYYPKEGEENLSEQEIIVPTMQEIFHLEGNEKEAYASAPKAEDMVQNITFEGFEVGYTEFTDSYSSGWNAFDALGVGVYPEEALQEGITQPSYCEQTERKEFRKGAFTLLQTSNITMDSLKIVNTGMTAMTAWGDNDHITLQNSELAHIGFHGINIDGGYPGPETGKYSSHHLVTNNVIHDVGELVGHGTSIQALQVHDSEFSHMEMYDSGRRAIFLEGGWAVRTEQDKQFNRVRDSHTYNNHLEYLYLHDFQQDGGDDGAIFFSTLYRYQDQYPGNGVNDVKPNYLNQVYMDNIGAPPSNKDFKPNCINFDMGCGGVEASNIKAVNPQHYNIRYNEGRGEVKFTNVNMAYYHEMEDSNYRNFDDSKMEYDKIGVNASFPYPDAVTSVVGKADKADEDYKDLYFRDEFDNGLDNWWSLAGTTTTTPLYYSDNDDKTGNSFLADAFYNQSKTGCRIGKPFGHDLNKIVEIDFFDHTCDGMEDGYCGMAFQYKLNSFARVDNGNVERAIGVNHAFSDKYYSYKLGSVTKVTEIPREYGWHTFKWDYTDEKDVKMYIDDQLIATVPSASFNYIEMGDYGQGGFNAYDNVVIYDGEQAEPPIELPEPPKPEEPEEIVKAFPGRIEAEDADERPDSTALEDFDGGVAIAYIGNGDVFKYNINVTEDIEQPFMVSYASNDKQNRSKIAVKIDGEKRMEVTLPHTGGWTTYKETVSEEPLALTKGEHVLEIEVLEANINLDGFACDVPPEPVEVESIEAAVKDELILGVGNEVKIPYHVFPKNADDTSVVWSTEDDGTVLTVAEDGTITATGVGTSDVTVTSVSNPKVSETIKIKVEDPEASLISTPDICTPSANVPEDHVNYKPEKLIDGNVSKGWAAAGFSNAEHKEDPSAYLTWEEPQTVKEIWLYDVVEGGNYIEQMEVIFNGDTDNKIVLENGVTDGGMEKVTLDTPKTDVTEIEFHILKATAPYGNYGFGEIKVFGDTPDDIPVNSVFFEESEITLFQDATYTLKLPVVVPSTATNKKIDIEIAEGDDVISLKANSVDGIVKNYTVTALKVGEAVIRATAENNVSTDFVVKVGSKEQLEDKIIEAENLYAQYPGNSDAHKAFKAVIEEAVRIYNHSSDLEEYVRIVKELDEAMKVFKEAMENVKPANKALLQKTYDYALTLDTESATDSAKAFFEKVLAEAKAVLDNEAATQEEINTAWNNLVTGIHGLGIVKGDTTMLELLVERAEAMIKEQDRYVQDKWNNLVTALDAAKKLLADSGDATPDVVDKATDDLLNAILEQRYKANKDNLKDLIDKVNSLDLSKYTKESADALKAALKAADAVMKDDSLSIDDQAKVDKATKELQAALDGLKLTSNDGNDDGDEGVPTPGGDDKSNGEDKGKDAPKTGDTMNVAVWLMVMAAVVVTVEECARRRRNKNR